MYLYMGVATVKYLLNDSDTLVVAGLRSSKKKTQRGFSFACWAEKTLYGIDTCLPCRRLDLLYFDWAHYVRAL